MFNPIDIELIIFDFDGTLVNRDTDEILSGVKEWFASPAGQFKYAIATNQGGVGLRYWMETAGFGEPENYPTELAVNSRLAHFILAMGETFKYVGIYKCFAYQSKSTGRIPLAPPEVNDICEWSIAFRKPAPGMLLTAMAEAGVTPSQTIMVGDRDEDKIAAKASGCHFIHADIFFNRIYGKS